MPDDTPRFRVSNEGDPIPPVDPEDLKRRWKLKRTDRVASLAAHLQESDSAAVGHRSRMVSMLADSFNKGQLLAPWQHGMELDDAVFRVAATFPIRPLRQHTYTVPGDLVWGFDPNAFVEKLIEETGISYTWEPVIAKIPEGSRGCTYSRVRTTVGPTDPETLKKHRAGELSEREARHDAQELLWAVWSKCQPHISRPSPNHVQYDVPVIAMQFADFVIDNIDLAREFVSGFKGSEGRDQLAILSELERNATCGDIECTVCQRPMCEHSDDEMVSCRQAAPPGTSPYRFRTS